MGRNDLCPCGSDKKFKKCHTDIYRKAERISRRTFNSQVNEYVIEGARIIEYPVDSWSGFTKK